MAQAHHRALANHCPERYSSAWLVQTHAGTHAVTHIMPQLSIWTFSPSLTWGPTNTRVSLAQLYTWNGFGWARQVCQMLGRVVDMCQQTTTYIDSAAVGQHGMAGEMFIDCMQVPGWSHHQADPPGAVCQGGCGLARAMHPGTVFGGSRHVTIRICLSRMRSC